jgi:hypothetical protein
MNSIVCQKCVNDTTIPGISFNAQGICNFCKAYESYKHILTDFRALEPLWRGRIEKYKGIGEYDAIVGLSGGKDSTYVLYHLIHTYHLKVKTWTIDNGFLTSWARERIEDIVSELGVEHEYAIIKQEQLAPLYQLSIMMSAGPCYTCSYVMFGIFLKTASEQGIPMAIHGRSRPQMLKIYSGDNELDVYMPFLKMALTPIVQIDIPKTYSEVVEILTRLVPPSEMSKFAQFFPDYKNGFVAELVPFFVYHPYNQSEILTFLEHHMNWKQHSNQKLFSHFDCAVHPASQYLYQLAEGRSFYMPELSVSIREGSLSRERALNEMEQEKLLAIPSESMKVLCDYIGKSEKALIMNAKRIAKRKGTLT